MKKRLTRGEKWLFASPLFFLVIAGAFWQWREKAPVELVMPDDSEVTSLEFSPDGKRLAVVLKRTTIVMGILSYLNTNLSGAVYDLKSRSLVCSLSPDFSAANGGRVPTMCIVFNAPAWSPDGNRIAASMVTSVIPPANKFVGRFKVWDVSDGRTQSEHSFQLNSFWPSGKLRFSSDGQTLIGGDIPASHFDVWTGKRLNQPDKSFGKSFSKWSEPLGLVASRRADAEDFRVVDLKTKRVIWKPPVKNAAQFDWYGDWLCVKDVIPSVGQCPVVNRLLLWNGRTRQPLPSPPLPAGVEIKSFSFNPAGKTLFYSYGQWTKTGYQAAVAAWDYHANRVVWRNENMPETLINLQPSPDGKWVMALDSLGNDSNSGYILYVFDGTGKILFKYGAIGYATRWSSDSKQLATVMSETDSSGKSVFNRIIIHRLGG